MPLKAILKRSVRQTADEADRVRELVAKFDRGPITKRDVLEACKIIQHEAVLLHDGGHRAAELLARCLIEILEKGKVKLSPANLDYIRQKLPLEPFAKRYLERLENS
ncbi:MAG: hypothetical protein AB1776_02410 [Bacillota bacterium]